jgi:site-specific recombinase XerD
MLSISIIIINMKMNENSSQITIYEAIERYLDNVLLARSRNTERTYRNALAAFVKTLKDHDLSPTSALISELSEDAVSWFANALKIYAPATERLYLSAVTGFYEYLAAERLFDPNLPRVRMLIKQRARRPGQRLPQFPRDAIGIIVKYCTKLSSAPSSDESEHLRNLRDRAFILILADTGLRVHEACDLRRGDIDWNEGKALIIGKGNQQDIVRISSRALNAVKRYIKIRSQLDGASGRPLPSLPIFARHDRGAGKKIMPITTTTGRNIVTQRVREALGDEAQGSITPHSFRHYFVTTVLRASGGNLKLAQELARHSNIQVTQRYAHLSADELDQGYFEIFET